MEIAKAVPFFAALAAGDLGDLGVWGGPEAGRNSTPAKPASALAAH